MSTEELFNRFKIHCVQNSIDENTANFESMFLTNFIRSEFLALNSDSRYQDDRAFVYLENIFSLSLSDRIEQNIPFLLIEDLNELGSYFIMQRVLTFLAEKSFLWASGYIFLPVCLVHKLS